MQQTYFLIKLSKYISGAHRMWYAYFKDAPQNVYFLIFSPTLHAFQFANQHCKVENSTTYSQTSIIYFIIICDLQTV